MDAGRTSIDPDEVEKFSKIADEWWDPFGKFKPLHKFNPARLAYIRDAASAHFGRDRRAKAPLNVPGHTWLSRTKISAGLSFIMR